MRSTKRKGFTLIEMLIVIVIIGILARALVPKLVGIQGKARDSARQSDLGNIGTALTSYFNDFGTYPDIGAHPMGDFEEALSQFLSSIPTDPVPGSIVEGIGSGPGPAGQYMFTTVRKNNIPDIGFVVMSKQESGGRGSNYIVDSASGSGNIDQSTEFFSIEVCPFVTSNGDFGANGNYCQSRFNNDFRYLYRN